MIGFNLKFYGLGEQFNLKNQFKITAATRVLINYLLQIYFNFMIPNKYKSIG
jgi:hypothetical protein